MASMSRGKAKNAHGIKIDSSLISKGTLMHTIYMPRTNNIYNTRPIQAEHQWGKPERAGKFE